MPKATVSIGKDRKELNARPDRLDLRDRPYRPPLRPIQPYFPKKEHIDLFLPFYEDLILDQGQEGACTGFGLAAVINYQYWFRDVVEPVLARGDDKNATLKLLYSTAPTGKLAAERMVSARMLYQLAKLYDEWDGEDYSGSSCRGAMRGWHHHGICLDKTWPYHLKGHEFEDRPDEESQTCWLREATDRPLGAYYRINAKSIPDMQAAIQEVHAIYVSAYVHDGWLAKDIADPGPKVTQSQEPADIEWWSTAQRCGVHAFAIVGYCPCGFIIQNSWGKNWGNRGFAKISYDDWLHNGLDAWAAVYGAPIKQRCMPMARSRQPLQASISRTETTLERFRPAGASLEVWDANDAYGHSIVLGNEGRPISRLVHAETGSEHILITAEKRVLRWCDQNPNNRDIVIFVHGGLNSEEQSIDRICVLGPYFKANGIYPLFVTWRSGLLETLGNIFKDAIDRPKGGPRRTESLRDFFDDLGDKIAEANDYTWEVIASGLQARALWTEMKENAAGAAKKDGGMFLLARHFANLREKYPELRIHLVGHSAGAIVLGELFDELHSQSVNEKVQTMNLYAPACTLDFAIKKFGRAIEAAVLDKGRVNIELLSEDNERDDDVAKIYRKSLLYLISRALEKAHKTPLLGLHSAWWNQKPGEFREDTFAGGKKHPDIVAWQNLWSDGPKPAVTYRREVKTSTKRSTSGEGFIKSTHGSFDNSVETIGRTIEMILGKKPEFTIDDLTGF